MLLLFIEFQGEVTEVGYRIILIIDGVNDIELYSYAYTIDVCQQYDFLPGNINE